MRCPKCNGTMVERKFCNNIICYECPFCGEITNGYTTSNCEEKTKYVYTTTSNAYPLEKDGITSGFINIHDNPTFKPIVPTTLEINCDSITLKNDSISFTMWDDKIKQFDTITINGVKFKKVEEENE